MEKQAMNAIKVITAMLLTLNTIACGTTSGHQNQLLTPSHNDDKPSPSVNIDDADLARATGQFLTTITHNEVSVQLIVDKPDTEVADVIVTFHGTVETDDKIVEAARKTLDETKKLIKRRDVLFVSVAYPEDGLMIGDNLRHSEAALLWVQQKASETLNVKIRRVFLLGHSQGGYIVTRLNAMHSTDGVIANAPGPLDFKLRCELEESGKIPESGNCRRIRDAHGSTTENPSAYSERSLLSHLSGFKSPILFTQGMSDTGIQLKSWPILKDKVNQCNDCAHARFEELKGGHESLFLNPKGASLLNEFIK